MTALATVPRRLLAVLAVVASMGLPVVAASPAAAATSYTWTGGYGVPGADHQSWGNDKNWAPYGVPGDGDSVEIDSLASQGAIYIRDIPPVTLSSFTVGGTPDTGVHVGTAGNSVTVTGSFTWTRGEIVTDVVLGPDATGVVGAGGAKSLSADLVDNGSLTFADTGTQAVTMRWNHRITVNEGATLTSTGTSGLTYDRCCVDPNRLVNHGTVDVHDGTFTLEGIQLDQEGAVQVGDGATLETTKGPVELGDGATYSGPGTVRLDSSPVPAPDAENPSASQGAVLLAGTGTLADGAHLVVSASSLTGTGALQGSGALQLADSTVYGDVTLGVPLSVGGVSKVGVWDESLDGYHGMLTLQGAADVPSGAELDLDPGTVTTVERGGTFTVAGGATIGSRSCCSDVPELVSDPGSRLVLGDASGPATLRWVNVRAAGRSMLPKQAAVSLEKTSFDQRGGRSVVAPGATLSLTDTSFLLHAGVLTGGGVVDGLVDNVGGTVAPGTGKQPGRLTVAAFRQRRHGVLQLQAKGDEVDQLAVTSTARLAGAVTVAGKPTRRSRSAVVLSAAQRSGTFSQVRARRWHVGYTRDGVTVTPR